MVLSMRKFDLSSGISKKEIDAIKFNVRHTIARKLPELPEPIETKLFFQGRDAWLYSWDLLNNNLPINANEAIALEVVVRLKREFHNYNKTTRYRFSCKIQRQEDMYRPRVTITEQRA